MPVFDDLYECYRLLEVEPGAGLDEVKRSYRELVKVWHPDRFSHDPKLREKAVDKLKKINIAYERLCEAGETFKAKAPPRDTSAGETRRRSYENSTYEHARTQREAEPEPPPPPPRQPPPPAAEPAIRPWRYLGPAAGIVATALLIYLVWPEPEPRFLIEVPPDAPPPAAAIPKGAARPAPGKPAPKLELPAQKFFGVGSTKEEVIEAQGKPDQASDKLLVYGTSDVYLENGKVKSWRNGFPRLKVKMFAAPNLGGSEHFTIGSTKDQVIHAQGTPDSMTATSFTYGTSKVFFRNDRVISWRIRHPALNVRLLPQKKTGAPARFTVGSTKDEVLAVQGTPDAVTDSEFGYGTSRVYFENGRVRSWQSGSPPLRAEPPA